MRPLLTILLLGLAPACASITASRTEPFSVTSSPPGAEVTLNGSYVGRTPVTVDVPRRMPSPEVVLRMAGHEPRSCNLSHSVGGGYVAANTIMCVLLFPIGCVSFIDGNGSWNELVTDGCSVAFEPPPAATAVAVAVATPASSSASRPPPEAPQATRSMEGRFCSRDIDCGGGLACSATYHCEQGNVSATVAQ